MHPKRVFPEARVLSHPCCSSVVLSHSTSSPTFYMSVDPLLLPSSSPRPLSFGLFEFAFYPRRPEGLPHELRAMSLVVLPHLTFFFHGKIVGLYPLRATLAKDRLLNNRPCCYPSLPQFYFMTPIKGSVLATRHFLGCPPRPRRSAYSCF